MRTIVIKQSTDLQALGMRLIGKKTGGSVTLERLKSLNPHVDFNHLERGTVLLLPDTHDLKTSNDKDIRSPARDAIDDFSKDAEAGFKVATERIMNAADALNADLSALSATVKTTAVKRLIDSDPMLKKQLEESREAGNNEQKGVQEAVRQVQALQKMVDEELAALGQMLR